MPQTPLLILGDNPLGSTGLGRIAKQIADQTYLNLSDVYRVGVAGYGGTTSRNVPYPVYPLQHERYAPINLPFVWKDFAGDEPGILFAIMNSVWLEWLVNPEKIPNHLSGLRDFLKVAKMRKWVYAAIDAEGINGELPRAEVNVLRGMNRVLAYTDWAAKMIDRSVYGGLPLTPSLPHGTDSSVFFPRSKEQARKTEFSKRIFKSENSLCVDTLLIGCVATNTKRKDWPLCFEVCQDLVNRGVDVGLWAHTNAAQREWDLIDMAAGFGMKDRTLITTSSLSDEDMAWGYAACDVTLGIGSGEGWGMPMSESLACGIPVVTGDYAGATEFVPEMYRVGPWLWRYDGFYCNRRPVFHACNWADRVMWARGKNVLLGKQFSWDGCWPGWEKWLREEL